MLITELNHDALLVALEEYKKSSYFKFYKPGTSIIESIKNDMIYFNDDGTILGEYRICSHCGNVMIDGYLIDEGAAYYCSDDCLYANMTQAEYMEMYESDDAFYTQWY